EAAVDRALGQQREAALPCAEARLIDMVVRLVGVRNRAVVVRADVRRLVLVAIHFFKGPATTESDRHRTGLEGRGSALGSGGCSRRSRGRGGRLGLRLLGLLL